MVGHQAIGPDLGLGLARRFRQEVAVQRIIVVAEERLLAPVATLGHVIGIAGQHEAGEASHADTANMGRARRGIKWGQSDVSP